MTAGDPSLPHFHFLSYFHFPFQYSLPHLTLYQNFTFPSSILCFIFNFSILCLTFVFSLVYLQACNPAILHESLAQLYHVASFHLFSSLYIHLYVFGGKPAYELLANFTNLRQHERGTIPHPSNRQQPPPFQQSPFHAKISTNQWSFSRQNLKISYFSTRFQEIGPKNTSNGVGTVKLHMKVPLLNKSDLK